MDQKKSGQLLRALRQEKGVTQEQLAEQMGVSNRSVSRWENGANMPDLDLLIELAKYYGVSLEEILDGEREERTMDEKTEEAILKVADYSNQEKAVLSRRLNGVFWAGVIAFCGYACLDIAELTENPLYCGVASFLLGLVFGVLLLGVLYTSRYMARIRAFKMRLLKRSNERR